MKEKLQEKFAKGFLLRIHAVNNQMYAIYKAWILNELSRRIIESEGGHVW